LLAWAATIGFQVEVTQLHLGLSDLFVIPLALWTLLYAVEDKVRLAPVFRLFLVFSGVFLTWSNLVTVVRIGYLPAWTYLNKDVGLCEMLVCLGAIVSIADSRIKVQQLVHAFVAGGGILNLLGITLMLFSITTGIGGFVLYGGLRYRGFLLDPNAWAGFLAVVAILQFCLLFEQGNSLLILIQWGNLALLIAGIVLSMSRSGIVSLLIGLAVIAVFVDKKRGRRIYATVICVVPVVFIPLLLTGEFQQVSDRILQASSISERMLINSAGLSMYMDSWSTYLFGLGIGTFLEKADASFSVINQIHNTYIWLLVEGGPLLIMLFVVGLVRALRQSANAVRGTNGLSLYAIGAFASIVSCLIFFTAIEGLYQRQVWLLLGLADLLWLGYNRPSFQPQRLISLRLEQGVECDSANYSAGSSSKLRRSFL
jgi:O-antigen ligase